MRTTLTIADDVLDEYRRVAAATHRTLSAVVEEGLRELAARRSTAVSRRSGDFTIVGGQGLRPGVTLDDNAALRELLDDNLPFEKRR